MKHITYLPKNKIFVFGSNRAGRHGKGAALDAAKYFGAVNGIGEGLQGQSYAIPTKDENLNPLPLMKIKKYVDIFGRFARNNPDTEFIVTKIGCGYAGYEPEDIKPFFVKWQHKKNIVLPDCFITDKTNIMSKDRIQLGKDAIAAGFAVIPTMRNFASTEDAKTFIDLVTKSGIDLKRQDKALLWESSNKDKSLYTVNYAVMLLDEIIKIKQ